MREIKFRAWDDKLQCYGHGCRNQLTDRNDNSLLLSDTAIGFKKHDGHPSDTVLNFNKCSWREIENRDRYSIEQFTGLLDKNGKEIYEGDRIRFINHYDGKKPVYCYHTVVWRDRLSGWFCLNENDKTEKEQDGSCQLWVYVKNNDFEIIGNIHQS